MQTKHIAAVFRKDAVELMRDRRTWFVNIVLPVLMYPVLAILGIQIFQVTQPGPESLPQLGIHNTPAELQELLLYGGEPEERSITQGDTTVTVAAPTVLRLKQLSSNEIDAFERYLHEQRKAEATNNQTDDFNEAKDECMRVLQELECAAVLLCRQDDSDLRNWDLELVANNAHPDYLTMTGHLRGAASDFRKQLLQQRLTESDLPLRFTKPALLKTQLLASSSESVRTHFLAAFLPVILVLMVIVGTFHPAPDLIAGERERGTLETLLSWPSDRQSIFIGKLLVVIVATIVTVLLNLTSLSVTAAIIGDQLSGGSSNKVLALSELVNVGPRTVLLSIIALFPVTIIIATLSLAVAGLAKSYKEAQNYLSPMVIVFTMPSMICLLPHIKPNIFLDLIPLIGPLVALKACLQNADMALVHLLIATCTSIGVAAIVVSWATTLLNKEQFLFPNLKNMSLKQLKQLRLDGHEHGGVQAFLMFATVLGTYLLTSLIFSGANTAIMVSGPLIIGIALPCLLFVRIGGYNERKALYTNTPQPMNWLWATLLIPVLLMVSGTLAGIQAPFMPENLAEEELLRKVFEDLQAMGGLPLLLFCVAVVPGICEEIFCRGILLSGFKKSLGPRYAIIMSAFLFAALHMSPWRFLPQFMLGIFLAVIVLRSHSIWLAMLIHFGHNGLVVIGNHLAEANKDNPEVQRMLQEAAEGAGGSASAYTSIIAFVVVAAIASALCMLIKPARIEAGSEATST